MSLQMSGKNSLWLLGLSQDLRGPVTQTEWMTDGLHPRVGNFSSQALPGSVGG